VTQVATSRGYDQLEAALRDLAAGTEIGLTVVQGARQCERARFPRQGGTVGALAAQAKLGAGETCRNRTLLRTGVPARPRNRSSPGLGAPVAELRLSVPSRSGDRQRM
jgi:hypothetical protein